MRRRYLRGGVQNKSNRDLIRRNCNFVKSFVKLELRMKYLTVPSQTLNNFVDFSVKTVVLY